MAANACSDGCIWLQRGAMCIEGWLQIAVHGCTWLQCVCECVHWISTGELLKIAPDGCSVLQRVCLLVEQEVSNIYLVIVHYCLWCHFWYNCIISHIISIKPWFICIWNRSPSLATFLFMINTQSSSSSSSSCILTWHTHFREWVLLKCCNNVLAVCCRKALTEWGSTWSLNA